MGLCEARTHSTENALWWLSAVDSQEIGVGGIEWMASNGRAPASMRLTATCSSSALNMVSSVALSSTVVTAPLCAPCDVCEIGLRLTTSRTLRRENRTES